MRKHHRSLALSFLFGLIAVSQNATAADLDLRGTVAPPSETMAFTWTGYYVGAHVGYGDISDHVVNTVIPTNAVTHFTQSQDGVIGGGQVGYVYQLPHDIVLGAEGDVTAGSLTSQSPTTLTVSKTQVFRTSHEDINLLATVRGRIGYAFDRLLVYGTGGLAIRNGDISRTQYYTPTFSVPFSSAPFYTDKTNSTNLGYVLGGGFEYAFAERWSMKVEYNYMRFSSITATFPHALAVVDNATVFEPRRNVFKDDLNLVKIGLNYEL